MFENVKLGLGKPLIFFFVFTVGFFLGFTANELYKFIHWPYPLDDIKFISACGDLNEKELTFNNLDSLGGYVFAEKLGDGPERFNEEYFEQYLNYIETGATPVPSPKIRDTRILIQPDSSIIFYSRPSLANVWSCGVRQDESSGKVIAKPKYRLD